MPKINLSNKMPQLGGGGGSPRTPRALFDNRPRDWGSEVPSEKRWSRGPTQLDREQLEYSATTLFTYGTILFLAIGVGASITYMTVQQLKK